MLTSIRCWLIRILAGSMPVVMNVKFAKGTLTLPRNKGGIVDSSVFVDSTFVYID